jgi:hypothetical protein
MAIILRLFENSQKYPIKMDSYSRRLLFIYAESFLLSADRFAKFLSVLNKDIDFDQLKKLQCDLDQKFPTLTKIRNSVQHLEVGSRGYGTIKDSKAKSNSTLDFFCKIFREIIKSFN